MWVLADTNGYVGAFDVYSGKKANAVERGLGANVVLSLTVSTRKVTVINAYTYIHVLTFTFQVPPCVLR